MLVPELSDAVELAVDTLLVGKAKACACLAWKRWMCVVQCPLSTRVTHIASSVCCKHSGSGSNSATNHIQAHTSPLRHGIVVRGPA